MLRCGGASVFKLHLYHAERSGLAAFAAQRLLALLVSYTASFGTFALLALTRELRRLRHFAYTYKSHLL